MFEYEVYKVIEKGVLKFVESFPAEWTDEMVLGILNSKYLGREPLVVMRPTGIATPEYFEAFAGVEASC